jgi:peptide/nickel transport system permease protein
MTAVLTPAESAAAPAPLRRGAARRILRNGRVRVGLMLVVPVLAIAIFGSAVAPHAPGEFVGAPFTPGAGSPFGTDNLGRDVLSRFLAGGRSLLGLSAGATVIGVAMGALLGSLTAYVRGPFDGVVMRLADVALAFPPIVLALMCLSLAGPKPWLIILVVAVGHLPRTLRVMRGAAMSVVERDYIRYCESVGIKRSATVLREILPNVVGPLMVEFGIRFTYSIGLVAGLSFLGLGVQPPAPDWGNMINENRIGLTIQPWGVLLPLLALAVLAIGSNVIADGVARTIAVIDRQDAR